MTRATLFRVTCLATVFAMVTTVPIVWLTGDSFAYVLVVGAAFAPTYFVYLSVRERKSHR